MADAPVSSDDKFDLETLFRCYSEALVKSSEDANEDVLLDPFLQGYKQIYILFGSLGRLFGFMSSDVAEKMKIIGGLRAGSDTANYQQLAQMLKFEAEKGLAPTKTKCIESGVRAYTRLHRGLAFVAELFKRLADAAEMDPLGPIAKVSYDDTLSAFHPWLIRKGVHMALNTLPYCLPLAQTLNIVDKDATKFEETHRERLRQVAKTVREVHTIGEKLLGDAKCLDLP